MQIFYYYEPGQILLGLPSLEKLADKNTSKLLCKL